MLWSQRAVRSIGCISIFLALALTLTLPLGAIADKTDQAVEKPIFRLYITKAMIAKGEAQIEITVPSTVRNFEAPRWYGNSPLFLKFISKIGAVDSTEAKLKTTVRDNKIEISQTKAPFYTLSYIYNIPQTVCGQVDTHLPVLNDKFARFDNNLTFLAPSGLNESPADLIVSPPEGWKFQTGWGAEPRITVPKVSQLISGLEILGDFDYSEELIGKTKTTFAIIGDFPHHILRQEFARVLQSQQETVGNLPSQRLLVAVQPTVRKASNGTSLTNALVMNIPSDTELTPFNFQVIGSTSHELFHQWNAFYITPEAADGDYLFSEGFTNYFAIAALVRAKLITEERFGRFLCHYRRDLQDNTRYPGSDHATIQAGLKNDKQLFDLCYTKGPFVAVLLDLALREDTDGKQCLASWFRALGSKFGGRKGYQTSDLRESLVALTKRPSGKAVETFDSAFIGGEALDLDALFVKLGINCDKNWDCALIPLSKRDAEIRSKVFAAED